MKVVYRVLALGAVVVATTASCDDPEETPPSPDASLVDRATPTDGATDTDGAPSADGDTDAGVDSSCVNLRMLESRWVQPAGEALFFSAQNCAGQALAGLDPSRFEVTEDGLPLPTGASVTPMPFKNQDTFVTVLVDMSVQTASYRPQLIAALRGFVDAVTAGGPRVQFSIIPFAGATTGEIISSNLDATRVKAKLDELATLEAWDPTSSDLFGNMVYGLNHVERVKQEFYTRNRGGAFSAKYLVTFSGGADTAKRTPASSVSALLRTNSTAALGVVMKSSDYTAAAEAALKEAAPQGVRAVAAAGDLGTAFQSLGRQIRSEMDGHYLLGYCSLSRRGTHSVRVGMRAPTVTNAAAETAFPTDGFSAGCSASSFTCTADQECGGTGCGTCDDRVGQCDGTKCVDHCAPPVLCDNSKIQTPLGYDRVCATTPKRTPCAGECVDTTKDPQNCGKCDGHCGSYYATCGGATPVCTCPGSVCPQPVATRQPDVTMLTVNATRAYFRGYPDNTIRSVPLGGGPTSILKTASDCIPYGLALDATSVYAACATGNLIRFPLAGGASTTLSTSGSFFAVAEPDSSYVYAATSAGSVSRVPLGGGVPETLHVAPAGTSTTRLVRVGTSLFWNDSLSLSVLTMPVTGGSPTPLVAEWARFGS